MKVKCMREEEGFTKGRCYELMGAAGESIVLIDDKGYRVTVLETSFEPCPTHKFLTKEEHRHMCSKWNIKHKTGKNYSIGLVCDDCLIVSYPPAQGGYSIVCALSKLG